MEISVAVPSLTQADRLVARLDGASVDSAKRSVGSLVTHAARTLHVSRPS
jgi:hypothetical protein